MWVEIHSDIDDETVGWVGEEKSFGTIKRTELLYEDVKKGDAIRALVSSTRGGTRWNRPTRTPSAELANVFVYSEPLNLNAVVDSTHGTTTCDPATWWSRECLSVLMDDD